MVFCKGGEREMFKFNSIEEALEDIKAGKIIIVIDDEDRKWRRLVNGGRIR